MYRHLVIKVVSVKVLHSRSVNVARRNVETHAVTQQRVPICALVRQVVPPPPL